MAWPLQVPRAVILEVASEADKRRYETFAMRSYVEDNRCLLGHSMPATYTRGSCHHAPI